MAKKASEYRAIYGLRNGHMHKALGLKPEDSLSDKHIDAASKSDNPHVKMMAALHKKNK